MTKPAIDKSEILSTPLVDKINDLLDSDMTESLTEGEFRRVESADDRFAKGEKVSAAEVHVIELIYEKYFGV